MRGRPIAALVALGVACWTGSVSAEQHFESGPSKVPLVELYTSEGCSSCPPADRWLSSLVDDPGLFETFVPVGFHVDYWNYIGWDDRFSSRKFSQRQRRYIDQGAARVVYTPGFFVAGEEWLGWRRNHAIGPVDEPIGNLSVRVEGNTVHVQFSRADEHSGTSGDRLDAHVVLLGMGIETSVRAGENRGRTLRHDFVALDHSVRRMRKSNGIYEIAIEFDPTQEGASNPAIAVWVAEPGSQAPLQATGGLLASR